jgi:general stress protein YciG
MTLEKAVREYMRKIGRKGGEVTGASKVRGDSEYYKGLVKAREAKRAKEKR